MILYLDRKLTASEQRVLSSIGNVEIVEHGTYIFTESSKYRLADAKRIVPGDWRVV